MRFGLSPRQSDPDFAEMGRQARLAESLGYACLWAHEHHSQAMMYPNPLFALAAMARETRTIALGTNMLLLPIHHPVRVAQDAAMLDVLSGGRLRLGVANGYSKTDLATFGVPRTHRGRRLEAGLGVIRSLFAGEAVDAEGEDFELHGFRLFPPPVQPGGPPLIVGGQAQVAIERAARLGDGYLVSTTEPATRIPSLVKIFRDARENAGKDPAPVILNRIVCCVETASQKAEAEDFFSKALLALYDSWGHANITSMGGAERREEVVDETHLIVGEPSECLERVARYREMGVDELACLMNFGAPPTEWATRSIHLLATKVLPNA